MDNNDKLIIGGGALSGGLLTASLLSLLSKNKPFIANNAVNLKFYTSLPKNTKDLAGLLNKQKETALQLEKADRSLSEFVKIPFYKKPFNTGKIKQEYNTLKKLNAETEALKQKFELNTGGTQEQFMKETPIILTSVVGGTVLGGILTNAALEKNASGYIRVTDEWLRKREKIKDANEYKTFFPNRDDSPKLMYLGYGLKPYKGKFLNPDKLKNSNGMEDNFVDNINLKKDILK